MVYRTCCGSLLRIVSFLLAAWAGALRGGGCQGIWMDTHDSSGRGNVRHDGSSATRPLSVTSTSVAWRAIFKRNMVRPRSLTLAGARPAVAGEVYCRWKVKKRDDRGNLVFLFSWLPFLYSRTRHVARDPMIKGDNPLRPGRSAAFGCAHEISVFLGFSVFVLGPERERQDEGCRQSILFYLLNMCLSALHVSGHVERASIQFFN